ncbi:MAG: hypothetical protein GTO18_12820 [Anaerolineales bacterium]|nr:hypothetical protein [Anaerolineales bacterium]
MFPRNRRRRTSIWGAIAVLGLLLVLAFVGAPRVMDVRPPSGSTFVPPSAALRVSFNRPMDRISVESRWSTSPESPGTFQWEGNSLTFHPSSPWPTGETVTLRLAAGSRSVYFLPIWKNHEWTFSIGIPRVLYLSTEGAEDDLHIHNVETGESIRITETDFGVFDYSVSMDGTLVVYSALRADDGSDLRSYDLVSKEDRMVYSCPKGWRCQAPQVSSDHNVLAFERIEFKGGAGGQSVPGNPQVWFVEMDGGTLAQPLSASGHMTSIPTWSSTGLLAFNNGSLNLIQILEFTNTEEPTVLHSLPSDIGEVGAWSPDGAFLLYSDLVFLDQPYESNEEPGDAFPQFFSHIFRFSMSSGLIEDLSGSEHGLVEDVFPVYSPDGQWILFARKFLEDDRWTPSRQLWLMRSDGTEARQITNEPDYNHHAISWSPESRRLTFMRTSQLDLTEPPEIWLYDLDTDTSEYLLTGGYYPQWIP